MTVISTYMLAIFKITCITILVISLNSCSSNKDKKADKKIVSINEKQLIDKKTFVEQGKERIEETIQFGPELAREHKTEALKDYARSLINKEDSDSYVNIEEEQAFPVDVNVENMDIRTFMQMMSKITGVNFLVSDEVGGHVSAKLSGVSWTSALDSILRLKSLAKHVDKSANIIRIHDRETITKLESFERQRQEDLQRTLALEKANEPLYTELFKLFYTKPDEVKSILEGVLNLSSEAEQNGVRNTNAQITADARINAIIVKARKDDLNIIAKVIEKVDTRTKQIFIEAFIIEVTDSFDKALGTRLGLNTTETFTGGANNKSFTAQIIGAASSSVGAVAAGTSDSSLVNLPVVNPTSGVSLLAGLGSSVDLKLELSAMEQEGLTKVISNPRIFTLDNQEAVIFQGSEIPYETVSQDGTSIQFKEAGLKLSVVPTVVGDGNLLMQIQVNKDTADLSVSNPPITKSEIKTNLVTRDGSIVVIGGIYTQTDVDTTDKVPVLGDIPVAGKLFKRNVKDNDRKELMIFLAPKVI